MLAYVVRRLLWGILIVWGVYTLAFFAVDAAPGDPFSSFENPKMNAEDFARLRAKWGYTKEVVETDPGTGATRTTYVAVPVWERYLKQLKNVVWERDLGMSFVQKRPVTHMLGEAIPKTLLLSGTALVLEFVIGVALGIFSAVRQNSRLDHALTYVSLAIYSMPGFWLALVLVLIFAVNLGWFPSSGFSDYGEGGLLDVLHHLALPAFVLGITGAASIARYQRSAMLEVIRQDYIRTARAKGLDEGTVIGRHALRNALIPVITLLGLSLPFLVSGAVITESIFAWPGMGQAVIAAIPTRDIFVITSFTLVASVMVVVGSIVSDILYAVVDPRVRYS